MKKHFCYLALVLLFCASCQDTPPKLIHTGILKDVQFHTINHWLNGESRWEVVTFEDGFVIRLDGGPDYYPVGKKCSLYEHCGLSSRYVFKEEK